MSPGVMPWCSPDVSSGDALFVTHPRPQRVTRDARHANDSIEHLAPRELMAASSM